jgi:DNA-binding transcriptional LysR family regulator
VHGGGVHLHKSGAEDVSIKIAPHMSANDASALYRLARAGAGLAVVPEFLALGDVAAGVVEFVLPEWKLDPIGVFAVWPSNAPKAGLINLFMAELGKVCGDGAF